MCLLLNFSSPVWFRPNRFGMVGWFVKDVDFILVKKFMVVPLRVMRLVFQVTADGVLIYQQIDD